MKKPAKTVEECIERLQVATDALVKDRVTQDTIVKALVALAIETGWKSSQPEAIFDVAEKAFTNAAYDAFEQAKKDRADKRAKRLGLTED